MSDQPLLNPNVNPATVPGTPPPGLEAGAARRRLAVWQPPSEHINSLLRNAGDTVLARARWLTRNNGYAKAALRSWGAATVGAGIKPSPMVRDPELRGAIAQAWLDWTDEADAEGLTDFYGITRRIAREGFLAGECFIRFTPPGPDDDLSVPLQLTVLPSEQLPFWKSVNAPTTGNEVRLGIEFDSRQRRQAYWFWQRNPSDYSMQWQAALAQNMLVRVPANEVLHVFDPVEAGQIRGLSSLAAAMVKMFMLDIYDDAELERKKQIARHATFIKKPPLDPSLVDAQYISEGGGGYYGPGATVELAEGEDVVFAQPGDVGASYEPFQYRNLLAISAATSIPYAELSADLNRTTYASSRAGLLAFRAEVEAFQHAVLVFQFLRGVYRRWMPLAVLSGAVPVTAAQFASRRTELMRFKAITPRAAWIDPLKDRQAEVIAVQNRFKALSDVIESEGGDPEEVFARIAADEAMAARYGVTMPSTAPAGSGQPSGQAAGSENNAATEDPPQPNQEDRAA